MAKISPGAIDEILKAGTYAVPGAPGISPDTMKALESVLWISQADRGWTTVTIRASIKPAPGVVTPGELRRGFLESYEQVLDILDQAGLDLLRDPELELSSRMGEGMEARITIELQIPVIKAQRVRLYT